MSKPASRGRKRKKRAAPLDGLSSSSPSPHRDEELLVPSSAQGEVTTPEGCKGKKRANVTASLDEPSTSLSSLHEDEELPLPSNAQEDIATLEESCLSQENKRSRVDDGQTEESVEENTVGSTTVTTESSTDDSRTDSEPITVESHTAENRLDDEPITIESPTISRSQEDVMIVGDVQVARPEVIDLERLPTIRQGGSVVVDLTNDSSVHDNNVVDLTRENPADSSIDSSPVIVCVNRIYRGDPIIQLPSCRFARPGMPSRQLSDTDVEIQEVVDNSKTSEQNPNVDKASTSSNESPVATTPYKKITCPICWDDEQIIKRRKRKLMSTTCGHVFCDQCIRSAVQMQNKCPTCRKKLTMRQLHPIFL